VARLFCWLALKTPTKFIVADEPHNAADIEIAYALVKQKDGGYQGQHERAGYASESPAGRH